MATALKTILVTGATGKQGGAVIKALLASNATTTPPQFNIIALTRDANSLRSKSLAAQPNVVVLTGDLSDGAAIFSKLTAPLHGVFSVQIALKPAVEEQQGKDLVDAAAKFGVRHFVYTSVDRGGNEKSDVDATPIPHFISKFNIEKHLIDVTTGRAAGAAGAAGATGAAGAGPGVGMDYTIIRPVAFMDGFTPDMMGRGLSVLWKLNGEASKLQLVSTKNIGDLAAAAFQDLEGFKGRRIGLAGDDLSWSEANEIFKRVLGMGIPTSYGLLGRVLRWVLHEQVGIMLKWFKDVGYGVDVEECRKLVPGLLGFEEWLRNESLYKDQIKK